MASTSTSAPQAQAAAALSRDEARAKVDAALELVRELVAAYDSVEYDYALLEAARDALQDLHWLREKIGKFGPGGPGGPPAADPGPPERESAA